MKTLNQDNSKIIASVRADGNARGKSRQFAVALAVAAIDTKNGAALVADFNELVTGIFKGRKNSADTKAAWQYFRDQFTKAGKAKGFKITLAQSGGVYESATIEALPKENDTSKLNSETGNTESDRAKAKGNGLSDLPSALDKVASATGCSPYQIARAAIERMPAGQLHYVLAHIEKLQESAKAENAA